MVTQKEINLDVKVDIIELFERLSSIETTLVSIREALTEHRKNDEKQDEKLDKIVNNDKDKLQRIARVETKLNQFKAATYILFTAVVSALVKSFFL